MEALAVLRLSVSPRRHNGSSHGYYLEDDIVDDMALPTPYTSAPSSPRRAFSKEVVEAPLGEVRAAIPFAWELIPGTPKHDLENAHGRELCVSFEESDEAVNSKDHDGSSSSSSSDGSEESLSRESSNTEFEFSSRFGGMVEPALPCAAPSMSTAEELFSNGQLVVTSSLRLPPRLQHLRNSDSSCSDVSSSDSFKSYRSPQSPQSPRPGSMKLSLCGFTKTTEEETIILGMQERKHRSLSPLRFFNRETVGSANSETYFSSDSNSSVSSSSSSSSGGETNARGEKSVHGSTLKELLFTDMAMASARTEHLKRSNTEVVVAKPRQVQSKLELLKKDQEHWNGLAGRPALTPQLSRSNARSRPAPSPSIDIIRVNSLRKENVGRVILANRFGMLCSCLGILPESP